MFTGRTNSYNGKYHKDNDAIMMWDAINEPRCPGTTSVTCNVRRGASAACCF
jgi:hypothetical protein